MIVLMHLILAAATVASPLQLRLTPGQHYSNIFSICIAFTLDGQKEETVFRNSGSATYIVNRVGPKTANITARGQYDGRAIFDEASDYDVMTHNAVERGKQVIDTDSSGFLYNAFMWGNGPSTLAVGATWNVTIPTSWELGPAGTQKVTVLALNPTANSATLQRDGGGVGPALDDRAFTFSYDGKKIKGTVTPNGPTTWHGISTFSDGLVMADSIIVTRRVWVTFPGGVKVAARERLYTLVAVVPGDT